MEYDVVEGSDLAAVVAEVSRLLRQGWKAQGGIAVANSVQNPARWWYYQAIVREG